MTACMHPRCDTAVRGHEIACPTHWKALDLSLRNRIWRTWKHRDTDPDPHTRAVGDAVRQWMAGVLEQERSTRCANCKAVALGVDEEGCPLCLVCARAALHPITGNADLRCTDCGYNTELLVSIDETTPARCLDCQIRTLAHV